MVKSDPGQNWELMMITDPQNPYGLKYFDKPAHYNEEEEKEGEDDELEEYDVKSCPSNCCDHDCECDDCIRCSNNGLAGEAPYSDAVAA
ncbi:MAG: hypothetical protein ACREBS_08945 [Nitrososphaerales archaeon]